MATSSAIKDVDETLINLLRNNMEADLAPNDPVKSIVLISPGEVVGNEVRLSLFLYQITENVHLKNQEMQKIDADTLNYPPIALDISYILTAYPLQSDGQSPTETTMEAHRLLGRAMQIFHDNTILSGIILQGELAKNNEELHITLNPLNLDDITKIWNTFQGKVWRPSVCYLVTPVMVESTNKMSIQRVVSKETGYHYSIPKREGK